LLQRRKSSLRAWGFCVFAKLPPPTAKKQAGSDYFRFYYCGCPHGVCPVAVRSRVPLPLPIQLTDYLQVPPHSLRGSHAGHAALPGAA
jgi:hypothetical protein